MGEIRKINVAFFDGEFTCNTNENRGIQELIQYTVLVYEIEFKDGMLISMSENPVCEMYEYVKPTYVKRLSNYIKKLTGISQKDVDRGGDFCQTMDAILTKLNKFDVTHIFVWGPDMHLINYNCKIRGYNNEKRLKLTEKFVDISDSVSKACELNQKASQHAMCDLFQIKEIGQAHDSKSDAINLSQIFRHYCGQTLPVVVD